jgi:transketolase
MAAIDTLSVNTIKTLAIDMIQKANSGHPGMPMGMADAAYVLWTKFLKHDPSDPQWADRDRFVLSAGHGSALLYSLLHLSGYEVTMEDLRNFRQWDSKTPGHPEFGHTVGVETTTGPLGQGVAMAVGFALAEARERQEFGKELCDHYTWAIAGDGCLMEGIAYEAASFAGHLGLGRLNVLWDDNEITIDGSTSITFTEDIPARFRAMGWHVQRIDGHDHDAIAAAMSEARGEEGRPSLICCRTIIGKGSPNKAGKSASHGSPLGADEIKLVKDGMGWDTDSHFNVPDVVRSHFTNSTSGNQVERESWQHRVKHDPKGAAWLSRRKAIDLDSIDWPTFEVGSSIATRKASHKVINAIAACTDKLIGGSADLAGSNGTNISNSGSLSKSDYLGKNINFGVREHAMAAICNGMALHGGTHPFCATFLVFHNYMRPAVRLSALMGVPVTYVYTHDSVWLGEDGPTHQPIEQLMSMRLIPNLINIRPADAHETVEAWRIAISSESSPVTLALSRQGLTVLDRSGVPEGTGLANGAYVVHGATGSVDVVLIATGSEVALAVSAKEALSATGVSARVVSMPSWELFEAQPADYQASVLPEGVPRVSIEAGRTTGWQRWTGIRGASVGIDRFGASAPGSEVADKLGMNVEAVVAAVKELLA